jgi:hypothetical protein
MMLAKIDYLQNIKSISMNTRRPNLRLHAEHPQPNLSLTPLWRRHAALGIPTGRLQSSHMLDLPSRHHRGCCLSKPGWRGIGSGFPQPGLVRSGDVFSDQIKGGDTSRRPWSASKRWWTAWWPVLVAGRPILAQMGYDGSQSAVVLLHPIDSINTRASGLDPHHEEVGGLRPWVWWWWPPPLPEVVAGFAARLADLVPSSSPGCESRRHNCRWKPSRLRSWRAMEAFYIVASMKESTCNYCRPTCCSEETLGSTFQIGRWRHYGVTSSLASIVWEQCWMADGGGGEALSCMELRRWCQVMPDRHWVMPVRQVLHTTNLPKTASSVG